MTSVQGSEAQNQLTDTMMDDGNLSPFHGTRNKVDMTTSAHYLLHYQLHLRQPPKFEFVGIVCVFKVTVTVVDIDSGAEEKIMVSSQGSATDLNLKENQRIYFGGLPSIGNYRYI